MARMTVAQWWSVMEGPRIALERIVAGDPAIGPALSLDDAGTVGLVFNQAHLRLRGIPGRGSDLELLNRGLRVLEALCAGGEIRMADPDEALVLCTALNLVDRTVRVATALQWIKTEVGMASIASRGAAFA